ncbi:capsular associated protein [Sistotremastrum suecicum HHB10207 ss-3]|uniref:Capsular associated protein n=1 Tax=Sistotremastrum suecicum HHB10207 ss-3 TaxID=1314776 RepID=A0A166F1C4_9AGAM|nr:capsular associated protein [Sistotremastrum suecicum HHB10207 ss-3]
MDESRGRRSTEHLLAELEKADLDRPIMSSSSAASAEKKNKRAWIMPVLFTLVVLQLLIFIATRGADSSYNVKNAGALYSRFGLGRKGKQEFQHPIPKLMDDAEAKFRGMMGRQSRTLEEATAEYERRYARVPPRGFDAWFQFAMDNDVKIIDEYDSMIEQLAPFWELSGEELRRRASQVGSLPSIDIVKIEKGKSRIVKIQSPDFKDSEASARARGFEVMIEKFIKTLPDMDFPINAKAEGRILVPWEHQRYPNTTQQDSSKGIETMLGGKFIPDWRGDGNVWEAYRRTCSPESQARRLFSSLRPQLHEGQRPQNFLSHLSAGEDVNSDFDFAPSVDDKFKFCDHPWARYQQGHFFSDWRTIPVLYPVFSPAKGDGFGDILIPSHYYYSSTKRYTYGWDPVNMVVKEFADGETAWEDKTDLIFWRGATTGGGSSPPGFLAGYQRHRFIRMASDSSDANRTIVFPWPPESENYVTAQVPVKDLNADFMDTAFTKAVGCQQYPGGCPAMQADHRFSEAVPLGEHWRHKYLVDFDGMGYSARVFAFLASESAVLKSTVYREFFSDWLQPWLHYIPLSMSYKEIYNIHNYFSGPTPSVLRAANLTLPDPNSNSTTTPAPAVHAGDARLRKIAKAGRQWKNTIGRKVDMEAYVYRLCIEYARLWADNRDAWNYLPAPAAAAAS